MTPHNLKAFEESDFAKQAVTMICQSLENYVLTIQEFTLVQDFLLVTKLIKKMAHIRAH